MNLQGQNEKYFTSVQHCSSGVLRKLLFGIQILESWCHPCGQAESAKCVIVCNASSKDACLNIFSDSMNGKADCSVPLAALFEDEGSRCCNFPEPTFILQAPDFAFTRADINAGEALQSSSGFSLNNYSSQQRLRVDSDATLAKRQARTSDDQVTVRKLDDVLASLTSPKK